MREQWTHLPDGRWIERIVSTNNGSAYVPTFTNRYVWDGNVLLAVLNNMNALELSFMRGLDLSGSLQGAGGVGGALAVKVGPAVLSGPLANTTHFYANDGNGNVTMLVNAADGTESARYEYGPFAEPLRITGPMGMMNPIRFSTQYADDVTGDIKYLYRDYTAGTGRWRSRDIIEEQGGLNLYAMVDNSPLANFDPNGLRKWTQRGDVTSPGECWDWCKKKSTCADSKNYDLRAIKFKDTLLFVENLGKGRTREHHQYLCSCYCPRKCGTCTIGAFANGSVSASKFGSVTIQEAEVLALWVSMGTMMCHTCGQPLTQGNYAIDHQPPTKLVPPGTTQVLLPQCLNCSRKQGGDVNGCLRHKEWFDNQPGKKYKLRFNLFVW